MTDAAPTSPFRAAVIGAGPAGLMAAEMLSGAGARVDVYDAMPSIGRKFLMAGKSGLNISHAEDIELFLSRYRVGDEAFTEIIRAFTPADITEWMKGLGVETRIGPTGRVFPVMMKASPLLRAWRDRLEAGGAVFHLRHRWRGWDDDGALLFDVEARGDDLPESLRIEPDAAIFALGGGSWRRLGSDGSWVVPFREQGIGIAPFAPSNVGFTVDWTPHLIGNFAGAPLKAVRLTATGDEGPISTRSECVITERGVESGGIYLLSAPLRQALARDGEAILTIDLLPDMEETALIARLARPRGRQSTSNYLRKAARLEGIKKALLYEVAPDGVFDDPEKLARLIKALPIRITGTAPIDEAISTAGGVRLSEFDGDLMLRQLPGNFCAGEMLDWDAPTGGYLITACLATGRRAGEGACRWLLDRADADGQKISRS